MKKSTRDTEFSPILQMRQLIKLYDYYLEDARNTYRLSHIEITIISFLHNNPGRDTAVDICMFRALPKGNVSQAVESLIQKGLLRRTPDTNDRRKIHLSLTDTSLPLVNAIEDAKKEFLARLFQGFKKEEIELFFQLNARMIQNITDTLERSS